MDPKLLYWTGAFANLGLIAACALLGVRHIRRGEVAGHRRMMLAATSLVGLFLVSYLLKVGLLGREDRSAWSALDLGVLYVHELCIAAMLIGGALAGHRAWRFRAGLGPRPPTAQERSRDHLLHRRSGWVALVGCLLGLVTAFGILAGMYARGGG